MAFIVPNSHSTVSHRYAFERHYEAVQRLAGCPRTIDQRVGKQKTEDSYLILQLLVVSLLVEAPVLADLRLEELERSRAQFGTLRDDEDRLVTHGSFDVLEPATLAQVCKKTFQREEVSKRGKESA
jgi:hypothetical protein